jgi:Na+-translocating ferredoxin:NAD+ oxidoreductase subunit A
MSEATRYFLLFFGAMMVYNILLIRFIALCSFFGVSNKMETSIGMGLAVIFVMTMATTVSWLLWTYLLVPLKVGEFLYIPIFIIVIAGLVQFEEMFIRKTSPALYMAMGIYLPLITTNCAVLAAATESVKPGFLKLNVAYHFSLFEAVIYTIGVAAGYTVAIIIFAAIRERIDIAPVPKPLKGYPLAFITAALMSMAFMGFANLFGI